MSEAEKLETLAPLPLSASAQNHEEKLDFGEITQSMVLAAPPAPSVAPPAFENSSYAQKSVAGSLSAPGDGPSAARAVAYAVGAFALVALGAFMATLIINPSRDVAVSDQVPANLTGSSEIIDGEGEPATTLPGVTITTKSAEVARVQQAAAEEAEEKGGLVFAPTVVKPSSASTANTSTATAKPAPAKATSGEIERWDEVPTPTPAPVTDANLPATPDKTAVKGALLAVRPAMMACANGRHGTAKVRLTVAPSGRVRNATVTGDFQGSSEGSCIARAARTARFPKFTQESFEVTFPYQL